MPLVRLELEDEIATVTLDRPDKRNALSPALLTELRRTLGRAEDSDPRALLLRGEGPVFCAGGDIGAMQDRLGEPKRTEQVLRGGLNPAIEAVATFPAPTVAQVHGAAVGAGLGLALACDVTLANDGAKLGAVHTRLGLTPDGGTSYLVTRLVGIKRALDLILEARTITGAEAAEMGLITRSVPRGELEGACLSVLERLAQGPTQAYLKARELVHASLDGSLREALDREAASQGLMYATEDQKEGVAAFLEGREPVFRGR